MADFSFDLDLTLLNEIADGSDEFIVESIDMFLEQTPPTLQEISNALAAKDWATAAAAAHKIKATLGFFGMLNSQTLIQDVELNCKTGSSNPTEIIDKFIQAQTLIEANTTALLKIKEEMKAKL
jgi:HPt (histidine-containing phosphotransfer) domain-containing protein